MLGRHSNNAKLDPGHPSDPYTDELGPNVLHLLLRTTSKQCMGAIRLRPTQQRAGFSAVELNLSPSFSDMSSEYDESELSAVVDMSWKDMQRKK